MGYVALQAASHPVLWTEAEGGQWIEPRHSLLPDQAMLENRDLAALVTGIGAPLVGPVQEGVLLACRRHMRGVCAINPARLRQLLRDKPAAAYLMSLAPDARVQVGTACGI